MEKAWDILNKLLDNFNLGRACIYTTSGLLFLLPLAMTVEMLVSKPKTGLGEEFIQDISAIFNIQAYILLLSYIFGFSIVSAMYPLIKKVNKEFKQQNENEDYHNINRHFSRLANIGNREPLGWLISEYFRFVEAAVYLPISLVFFLILMSFYFLAGIPKYGLIAFCCATVFLGLFLLSVFLFRFFWKPKVIVPTVQYFLEAKRNLIDGLESNSNSSINGQSQHG